MKINRNIRPTNKFSLLRKAVLNCAILCLLFITAIARAGCTITATPTPQNLGTTSASNVYNASISTSGPGGLSCSGLSIGLAATSTVNGTVTSTTNGFNLVNTGNAAAKIPYNLYGDNTTNFPFRLNSTMDYGSGGLNLLNLLLVGTGGSTTVYVRTSPGANIPAGLYTDTIVINWYARMCLLNALGVCVTLDPPATGTSTIQISLTVTNNCVINSTPNVQFTSSPLVEQFQPITQSVTLTCTLQAPYKAYFSSGSNFQSPWRQMKGSSTNMLQYNIYYPTTSTVWDSTTPLLANGTGLTQSISYTTAINPNQLQQPQDNYTDSINFTVEY
ncbi:Csu type fimbrial protein [Budvicia diplopodorum]|uniref:Csu type fimbrial protein n=1 Tax=Budvicia diplopodorum TaxID=1119056 RepID=UPI0013575BE3|nr:spore coat protein U domain-containing protein [Budvicia diplopodorum]